MRGLRPHLTCLGGSYIMTAPMVNFLSYNSTGMNTVKASWIRDLLEVTCSHFVGIQEHFKRTKTVDKFFRDNFSDFSSFVVPAHREEGQDSGRAKGGLATLSCKQLKVKCDRFQTKSYRLQAQTLYFPNTRILWINVYFPTDPQTVQFDESALLEVIGEIEAVMDCAEYDDCILQGDLNWDSDRQTGFSILMKRFCQRTGLVSVWDSFPIDYTHIHTDLKSVSKIDHFLVNERLLEHVVDAGPLHLGDNLSRHSPVIMKLNIGNIPLLNYKEQPKLPKRPLWYKADTEEIDNYTKELELKLAEIYVPETLLCQDVHCQDDQHCQDRDHLVLDMMSTVIETSHQTIPLSRGGKMKKIDPRKHCPIEEVIPGWTEIVAPYKRDAAFWHFLWREADRPDRGEVRNIMVKTRNQYHYAVRKVKKMAGSIRERRLLEASEAGSVKLLEEMRKVRGGKKDKPELPENVAGVCGEDLIVDKFREVYEQLYNSWDTSEVMNELKKEIFDKVDSRSVLEAEKVTGAVVKEAARSMKPGKSDVSESYTSDAILNAPDSFFDMIAIIYRSWLVHGSVTLSLLACAFLPLVKGRKDPGKTDSYRAIAGSALLLKLFDKVVLLIWGHMLASDPLQFGYKAGTSTTQCSWMVMEVAGHFLRRGTPCMVTLLDCSKAFDMVEFSTLFKKLSKSGVPPIVIRVLVFVYEEQFAWVKWGKSKSKQFRVVNGTRQGSVLSPALFSLYMDELLKKLRKLGVGCHISGIYYGAALYADDLVLLAPSRTALQHMLNICEQYAGEHNLVFSTDPDPQKSKTKSLYMVGKVRGGRIQYPKPVRLCGVDLPWVASANHLGHELHQDCSMEHDARSKRMAFITESTDIRETFAWAHPMQILEAIRVYTTSFYGSMLYDLYGEEASKIYRCWKTAVKLAWGVPRTTFSYLVDHVLVGDMTSVRDSLMGRYIMFSKSLTKSATKEIRVLASIASTDSRSNMGSNLMKIKAETGVDPLDKRKHHVMEKLLRSEVPEEEMWRVPLITRLLEENRAMKDTDTDCKNMEDLIDMVCTSTFS